MTIDTQTGKLVKPGQLYEIAPDGTWRFFFDSSAIRTFRECPQKFRYKYIDNIRTRGRAWKTEVGSWWSSTLELYYKAFQAGSLTKTDAVEFALHCWQEHDMDSYRIDHPASYEEFGGRVGAATMVSEYFDWAIDNDKRNWKVFSVEEGVGRLRELCFGRMEDKNGDAVEVYYIIKPDLYVFENNVFMPVDHKTKDYIKTGMQHNFKPHFQTMGYIIAAQALAVEAKLPVIPDRCLINAAARNTPGPRSKNQARFCRYPISYDTTQLMEWRERVLVTALELRRCIERDIFPWTESACHMYSGCEYRPIDSVPAGARLIVVRSSYTIGSPWIPYKTDVELGGEE